MDNIKTDVQEELEPIEPEVNDDDGLTDAEADAITLGERYDDAYDHLERDHDEPYIPEQE
jgi:hypothetical protein